MIEELVTTYETVENFSRDAAIPADAVEDMVSIMLDVIRDSLRTELLQYVDNLTDVRKWLALAAHPKQLTVELKGLQSAMMLSVSRTYGVAAHRPTQNTQRDAEICRYREIDKLNPAQIGRKLSMKPNAVELAYKRYKTNEANRLRHLVTFLIEQLLKAYELRKAKNAHKSE